MSEVIKTIIETTGDRTQVFKLISESDDPLAVLHVWTPTLEGELWIEKSERIFFACTTPSVSSGMMALLQLLAAKDSKFTLKLSDLDRPEDNVDISLQSLISDEQAVIQEIKDVLWPIIERESDILTEAVPALPLNMLHESYSQTQERERKEWETLTATSPEPVIGVQDFTPPSEAASESSAAESVTEEDKAPVVPPSLEESLPEGDLVEALEPPAIVDLHEQPVEEDEQARTIPPGVQAQVSDSDAVSATESLPEADLADQSVTNPDELSLPETSISATASSSDEQLSDHDAYAILHETVAKEPSPIANKAESELVIRTTTASSNTVDSGLLAELDADDPVTQKRREDMVELQAFYGEEPEKFYVPADTPVGEDDIEEGRKAEMEALSSMLAVHSELQKVAFEDQEPMTPDEMSNQRAQQFGFLSEFLGEKPENFYDGGSGVDDVDPTGLQELRSKVMKAMEEESDPLTFAEHDPELSNDEVLLPEYVPPGPEPVVEAPVKVVHPLDDYTPPDMEVSQYGQDGSELNFGEKLKGKLLLDGAQDNKSLLDRTPNAQNKFGKIDRDSLKKLERLPRHMLISVCLLAALLPLIVLFVSNHLTKQNKSEREDALAVAQLANMASQDASRANKPQQAFRMPDGPVSPTGGGASSSSSGSGQAGAGGGTVTEDELAHYKYRPNPNMSPRPTNAQNIEANRDLALGDQMMSLGRTSDATRVFANGLLKCPNHAQLRIRAARSYMALRQFQAAKEILIGGMGEAGSAGEYNMYLSIMKEIPRG